MAKEKVLGLPEEINPNYPAFPTTAPFSGGVTIRAYIATNILAGLITVHNGPKKDRAKQAVEEADALIEQLNK